VAGIGFILLLSAGVVGAFSNVDNTLWMTATLVLLGTGWNFGVVGGSTMLDASVPAPLRPHVEGLGEVAMGLAAGAGAPIAVLIVAFGGFAALFLAGTAAAILALAFSRRAASLRPRRPSQVRGELKEVKVRASN
jgi:MFS family permease